MVEQQPELMRQAPGLSFRAALDLDRPDCLLEKACPTCGRGVIYYLQAIDEPLAATCPKCGSVVDLRVPEIIHPRMSPEEAKQAKRVRALAAQGASS